MAIIDMMQSSPNQPVTLQQIAERQNISIGYLEQIFMILRRQNIVKSIRGPGGGYLLRQSPDKIKVLDVLSAMGDSLVMTRCKGKANCAANGTKCSSHDFLTNLEQTVANYLNSVPVCEAKSMSRFEVCS